VPRIFFFAALISVVFATLTLAAPIPKQAIKPTLYHPTQIGTKWVYDDGTQEETHALADAVESVAGTAVNLVVVDEDGVAPWQKLLVSGTGITRIELFGTKLDPPDTLVQLPAKRGDSWGTKAIGKRDGWDQLHRRKEEDITIIGKREVGMVEERVKVPAGEFTAIRVDSDLTLNGHPRQSTAWYAPGVGLVKLIVGNTEKVLKSFTPGKP
jgi:hypothetical protein